MVDDRGDNLDNGLRVYASPSGFSAEVDTARDQVRPGGAVEGDDDRHGPGPLAIGAVVIGDGMLHPVGAVRVHLSNPDHSFCTQVAPRDADRVGRHHVVSRSQDRIGNHRGHGDADFSVRRGTGVSSLIDAKAVQVRDTLDSRCVFGEQVEHRIPDGLWDADLGFRHAACFGFDRPR